MEDKDYAIEEILEVIREELEGESEEDLLSIQELLHNGKTVRFHVSVEVDEISVSKIFSIQYSI